MLTGIAPKCVDPGALCLVTLLAAFAASPAVAQQVQSTRAFDPFVGRWTGESTFVPPFTPNAQPLHETIDATCEPVLSGAYIQCEFVYTRASGRTRGVTFLWNYNEVAGRYESLILASNYGQAITYGLEWDPADKAFIGLRPYETPDGRPATERMMVRASEDGRRILGLESVRPDANPTDPWIQTFEYTLNKVD